VPTIDPDRTRHAHEKAAPPMPSFDSLRDPRRRTAIDLLVPASPLQASPAPASPPATGRPAPGAAPRPPDYADLVRLGVHLARVSAAVPLRLVRWSAGIPVRGLRRLLGG
jgi:hypothetical protein